MKLRSLRAFAAACGLAAWARAQTTPVQPPTVTPVPVAIPRFADLSPAAASPAVAVPAQAVAVAAATLRVSTANVAGSVTPVLVSSTALVTPVAQASQAIVREGQAARAETLAGRQSAVTRLRLAQTENERLKLIEDLRLQAGDRLDEQREVARLVRDRLRQVRDSATLVRPTSP